MLGVHSPEADVADAKPSGNGELWVSSGKEVARYSKRRWESSNVVDDGEDIGLRLAILIQERFQVVENKNVVSVNQILAANKEARRISAGGAPSGGSGKPAAAHKVAANRAPL